MLPPLSTHMIWNELSTLIYKFGEKCIQKMLFVQMRQNTPPRLEVEAYNRKAGHRDEADPWKLETKQSVNMFAQISLSLYDLIQILR